MLHLMKRMLGWLYMCGKMLVLSHITAMHGNAHYCVLCGDIYLEFFVNVYIYTFTVAANAPAAYRKAQRVHCGALRCQKCWRCIFWVLRCTSIPFKLMGYLNAAYLHA